jgi:protein-disulfide isomerase
MRNAAALALVLAVVACQRSKPSPSSAPVAKAPAPAAAPARKAPRIDRRPAAAEGIARGPANALINVVEFADFQCSYCREALPIIERVMKEYPGKVRIFYRHLPMLGVNEDAVPAAEAAMAAHAQGKFWEMHDTLFANQRALKRPALEGYARALGLDLAAFRADMDGHRHLSRIQSDMAAAQELGAKFTPIFFINGRPLGGAQPFEEWKLIIDDELARARALTAAGVPEEKLYERLMADAAMPGARPAAAVAASSAVHKVPIGRAPTRGARQPKVTIVEFCEFQCPYCKAAQPTLKKVLETYGDDVQLAWKNLPLPMHRHSAISALAADAAGTQGKFWEMHDKLFANQAALDRPSLERYAGELGLDLTKFKAALDTVKPDNVVDSDAKEAQRFGQTGTPAFFINGRSLVGAQPFESFKAAIDEEIGKADAKLAAGVPRDRLYQELTRDGLEKAEAPPAAHEVARAQPDPTIAYRVELGDAPVRGARDALVTIVVFSDFECPYCGKVEPTLDRVLKEYAGKVRVAWKDFPLSFHPNAIPAALAARAAGEQGKFWPMHDRLFEQRTLDRASLEGHARALGLDLARFKAALDSGKQRPAVLADARQGAEVGVTGTPAFFINGILLSGAQPYETFKAVIDGQLEKARALVARGTPRRDVYAAIMKTASPGVLAATRAGRRP